MRKFPISNFQTNLKSQISHAFTLLEMLVVIGIIAVLVGMGSISYSTAQKKARDAKRKGDLNAIQNALEQHYSICNYSYPIPTDSAFSNIYCASPTTGIMPTVPTDPKTTTPYPCNPADCTSTGYKICTNSLESESPTGYCLSNQQ
jgi:prepilin-type N-terminal cleavage/methylation domain-containing protein